MAETGRWATIKPFISSADEPKWVVGEDRTRLAAYDVYEAIYWTAPDSFKLTMRGQEGEPIFIPSGRKVVETAHRFTAPKLQVASDPAFGTEEQQKQANTLLMDFFRRERFLSKFSANKRDGIMKGDWLFHLFADPGREEGARMSILSLDPSTYFPEYAEEDPDQLIAVHLAESTMHLGKPAVRRLTYRKETEQGGPSPILVSDAIYAVDEWGQPGTDMTTGRPISISQQDERLPDPIDQFPVYHIPNGIADTWGSSEMRGVERLMSAINQAITDEELTLILEGLGVYVTTAGAPVNDDDEEIPWNLGPGRVVEIPEDKDFKRVSGTGSISPYQEHLKYLHRELEDVAGGEVPSGRVDVQVAESGIALAIRMSPYLAHVEEKDLVITDVLTNMFFDLRKWFTAYENVNLEEIRWLPAYGEKLPINKQKVFDQIMKLAEAKPPIVSGQEVRRMLARLGMGFTIDTDDTDLWSEILEETADFAKVQADADILRIESELGDLSENGEGPEPTPTPAPTGAEE